MGVHTYLWWIAEHEFSELGMVMVDDEIMGLPGKLADVR